MPEIQRLSHRHEAIMEWLIANPEKRLGECALVFGVSQAWLSTIIHSGVFRDRYQALIGEHIDDRVMPIRDQLTGVAVSAIEKLGRAVDASIDPDFILSVADKTLHRLGYAPSKAPSAPGTSNTQVNNFYSVSKEELEAARARRRELYEGTATDAEELPRALPAAQKV